jgi:hypothetical protein
VRRAGAAAAASPNTHSLPISAYLDSAVLCAPPSHLESPAQAGRSPRRPPRRRAGAPARPRCGAAAAACCRGAAPAALACRRARAATARRHHCLCGRRPRPGLYHQSLSFLSATPAFLAPPPLSSPYCPRLPLAQLERGRPARGRYARARSTQNTLCGPGRAASCAARGAPFPPPPPPLPVRPGAGRRTLDRSSPPRDAPRCRDANALCRARHRLRALRRMPARRAAAPPASASQRPRPPWGRQVVLRESLVLP